MTNSEISKYIRTLNQGSGTETIFTRRISKNVELAKVWEKRPKPTDSIIGNFNPFTFFFIKSESSEYVGAVLDMGHDLHWYISQKHRKKGYLVNALKSSILPFLLSNRNEQRISIDKHQIGEKNYENSKRVAELVGFKRLSAEIEGDKYSILKEEFDWENEKLDEKNSLIGKKRIEELCKKAFYATKLFWLIKDELEMKYGDSSNLDCYVKELRNYTWKIEDLMFEYEK
ncbi:MAG: hypothetical protein R2750_04295 [Bacteroidales bacterium]